MRVHDRSRGDSVLLFILWGPGFLCKCKGTFTALLLVSPSVWRLSIVTDGRASSDWSPGLMLMCVHLGDVCVMLGSSLVFLVFFVYVLIRKRFVISILSQQLSASIACGGGVLKEAPICGASYISDTIEVTRIYVSVMSCHSCALHTTCV